MLQHHLKHEWHKIDGKFLRYLVKKTDGRFAHEIEKLGLFTYIYLDRSQSKPSYVFKHTRVVECSKDKKFTEIATLGALEKVQRSTRYGSKPSLGRFEKFAKMNNAICCSDIEQKLNYYDKLEDVGAIIYGTQDTSDCALFKEYLAEQKRLQEEVAQNTAE